MSNALRLSVRPLAGALGAEIRAIDLARPLDSTTVEELHELLVQYLVLFFPEQDLTDDDQLAFARLFGEPYLHPLGRLAGKTVAGVERIIDDIEHPPYQDQWHTDVSWDPHPPTYGTLRSVDIPSRGGDTIWASMFAAYDALSPVMRDAIDPLVALHDMGIGAAFVSKAGAEIVARTREQFPGTEHPVVGVHPATGRKYLNVNKGFTQRIIGMHADESAALLGFLVDLATHPNFQMRHSWKVGELAIWDERCTHHFAVADFLPERREMARVAIARS